MLGSFDAFPFRLSASVFLSAFVFAAFALLSLATASLIYCSCPHAGCTRAHTHTAKARQDEVSFSPKKLCFFVCRCKGEYEEFLSSFPCRYYVFIPRSYTCLPVYLPACTSICLSICPPTCLPACLSACLSTCFSHQIQTHFHLKEVLDYKSWYNFPQPALQSGLVFIQLQRVWEVSIALVFLHILDIFWKHLWLHYLSLYVLI